MRKPFTDLGIIQFGAGDFEVFRGVPYQRGRGIGSLFRGAWNMAVPFLKKVGTEIGKQALLGAADIAQDIAQGTDAEQAVKHQVKKATARALKNTTKRLQRGGGADRLGVKRRAVAAMPINRGGTKKRKKINVDIFAR